MYGYQGPLISPDICIISWNFITNPLCYPDVSHLTSPLPIEQENIIIKILRVCNLRKTSNPKSWDFTAPWPERLARTPSNPKPCCSPIRSFSQFSAAAIILPAMGTQVWKLEIRPDLLSRTEISAKNTLQPLPPTWHLSITTTVRLWLGTKPTQITQWSLGRTKRSRSRMTQTQSASR